MQFFGFGIYGEYLIFKCVRFMYPTQSHSLPCYSTVAPLEAFNRKTIALACVHKHYSVGRTLHFHVAKTSYVIGLMYTFWNVIG